MVFVPCIHVYDKSWTTGAYHSVLSMYHSHDGSKPIQSGILNKYSALLLNVIRHVQDTCFYFLFLENVLFHCILQII